MLIYDKFCRDIISPILKLHELRRKGVTLHMLLDAERDAIPDVPAIYFVEPTAANIERIVADCAAELYSAVHLNFASPLSRDALELLARRAVDAGCTSKIAKVFDQHTNFVSLEPRLFSLNVPRSYCAYNDPSVQDAQIEQSMRGIVQGLFSVLATAGAVPVIRCPNNDGPSRMVAEQLSNLIREHLVRLFLIVRGGGDSCKTDACVCDDAVAWQSARNGVFSEGSASFQVRALVLSTRPQLRLAADPLG